MQTHVDDKPKSKIELAEYFGVHPRTIDGWMARGIIPYWRVGGLVRFDLPSVIARLNEKALHNARP